jgi:hypothetical protein
MCFFQADIPDPGELEPTVEEDLSLEDLENQLEIVKV